MSRIQQGSCQDHFSVHVCLDGARDAGTRVRLRGRPHVSRKCRSPGARRCARIEAGSLLRFHARGSTRRVGRVLESPFRIRRGAHRAWRGWSPGDVQTSSRDRCVPWSSSMRNTIRRREGDICAGGSWACGGLGPWALGKEWRRRERDHQKVPRFRVARAPARWRWISRPPNSSVVAFARARTAGSTFSDRS